MGEGAPEVLPGLELLGGGGGARIDRAAGGSVGGDGRGRGRHERPHGQVDPPVAGHLPAAQPLAQLD